MNQDDFDIDTDERPSRSQLKRDAEALQDLGRELVELPQARLDRIELPEKLREAIDLARRTAGEGGTVVMAVAQPAIGDAMEYFGRSFEQI